MARGQTSQGPWATPNRWAYRLHYRVAQWRAGKGARRFGAHKQPPPPPPATGRRPLLYLSWGRIGDTVLATAVTRHFRAWFDRPIVMVGRPEVEAVVAPHVDRFVAFDQRSWFADDDYRQSFAASIHADYEIVLGDAQYFHGAGVVWNHLVDAVPARHKFVYEGHAPRAAIAPHRPWPRTATVIPSLPKPDPGDLEQRHLWHDLRHYAREVLLTAGIDPGDSLAPPRCRPVLDEIEAVEPTGLPPGPWIACQPFSNNRKKDVSADTWRQVFAAHPTARFLLLGSTAQAAAADRLTGPRVHSLCGRSSVRDSIAYNTAARGTARLPRGTCRKG